MKTASMLSSSTLSVICPDCGGTGILNYTVNSEGKETKHSMNCITCNGNKKVSSVKALRYQQMKDAWCKCEIPGDEIYYDYGNCHGYNCSKCGKILQTG